MASSTDKNLLQSLKKAIEENDFDTALSIKEEFTNFQAAFFYAIREEDDLAIQFIDNSQRLNISLSEISPLILACL